MTAEDTITALRAENARLCADVAVAHATIATLSAQVATLLERVKDLEGQRATTSRNSSKPPSSDGRACPGACAAKAGRSRAGNQGTPARICGWWTRPITSWSGVRWCARRARGG